MKDKEQETLSNKRFKYISQECVEGAYREKDVKSKIKEFTKKLKELIQNSYFHDDNAKPDLYYEIDKLALEVFGNELSE